MSLQSFNKNAKEYLAGAAMLASAALPLSAQADAPSQPITPWDHNIEYVQNLEGAKAFSSENCPKTFAVTNIDKRSKGFTDLAFFIAQDQPEKTFIHIEDSSEAPYIGLQLCGEQHVKPRKIDPADTSDLIARDGKAIDWGADERRRNSEHVDTLMSLDPKDFQHKDYAGETLVRHFTSGVVKPLMKVFKQRKAESQHANASVDTSNAD